MLACDFFVQYSIVSVSSHSAVSLKFVTQEQQTCCWHRVNDCNSVVAADGC